MAERDWRPRDAAERAHEHDRVAWNHQHQVQRVPPAAPKRAIDKDAIFTSEEAMAFDRGVVDDYDEARRIWVEQPRHRLPDVPRMPEDPWGKDAPER